MPWKDFLRLFAAAIVGGVFLWAVVAVLAVSVVFLLPVLGVVGLALFARIWWKLRVMKTGPFQKEGEETEFVQIEDNGMKVRHVRTFIDGRSVTIEEKTFSHEEDPLQPHQPEKKS